MFREITISKQSEGGPKRRWYQSEYFDLYIFYVRHSERMDKFADREFVGMQLCYDIRRNQRTLEWKKTDGFAHHAVKKGGGDTLSDHGASTALLQKGGQFDSTKVIDRFMADSGGLPGVIKTFVLQKLAEYAKLNPPPPPTQAELDAAAAAALVAEQIAAQVEAEAEALQAEQAAAAALPISVVAAPRVDLAAVAVAAPPAAVVEPSVASGIPAAALVPPAAAAAAPPLAPAAPAAPAPAPAARSPAPAPAARVSAPAPAATPSIVIKSIEDFTLDDLLNKT